MSYQATIYNVMIASPGDVAPERAAVRQVVSDWNVIQSQASGIALLPVGWETHSSPAMGHPAQKILNEQILERSDLLVGVFWTRLGTPTAEHPSGSVEEIEKHVSANKPVMLYFSNQPVRLESVDSEQYKRLLEFKESCKKQGLLEQYDDLADFREKFFRQLQLKLNQDPYFKQGANGPASLQDFKKADSLSPRVVEPQLVNDLSEDAKLLLATAAAGNGTILRIAYIGGTHVAAGDKEFIQGSDRRAIARWEAAVDELEREGLAEDKAGKRQLYFVTNEGYRVADGLPKA